MPVEKVRSDVGTRGIALADGETADESVRKMSQVINREVLPVLKEIRRRLNELIDVVNAAHP